MLAHLRSGLGHLALLTLSGAILNFLGQGLLARMLDPAELGRFGNALAQATFLAPLGGLGIYGLWLRVFSENGGLSGPFWLRPSLLAATVSSAILTVGFAYWGFWQNGIDALLFLLMALHIPARVAQELAGGVYQVGRRYFQYSLIQFWPYALRLPVLLLCAAAWPYITPHSRLLGFATGHFLYSLALIVFCLGVLRQFLSQHRPDSGQSTETPKIRVSDVLAGGWPFLSSSLLFTLFGQAGIVIVAQVVGYREAAIFMVANMCASAGYMGISILYQRYWQPRMFRLVEEDPDRYVAFITQGFKQSIILALLAVLALSFVAWILLVPIFGPDYRAAAPVLQFLSVAVGLRCLNSHCSSAFVREEDLSLRTRKQMQAMIVILPLMLFAANVAGLIGVAAAAVAYEALLLTGFYPHARFAGEREISSEAKR